MLKMELQEDVRDWILKVAEVSTTLHSPLTTEEISRYFLPKVRLSSSQVAEIVRADPELRKQLVVKRDFVIRHGNESHIEERLVKREAAARKMMEANHFAMLAAKLCSGIRTIAVSGSVAYQSASTQDDVDLFVVTKSRRLWITIFLMLVLFRIFKLRKLWVGQISLFCLSYVHDELGFAREVRSKKTALFGRELLMAVPLVGSEYFRRILESSAWISEYYPEAYSEFMGATAKPNVPSVRVREPGGVFVASDFVDAFAYALVGTYLSLRAFLRNLRFASSGDFSRIFRAQISRSSCIYSSNFYVWLQSLWGVQ